MRVHFRTLSLVGLCVSICMLGTSCKDKQSSNTPVTTTAATTVASGSTTTAAASANPEALPENKYVKSTYVLDTITVHAGDTHVPVRMMLFNNPGYSSCGLRLFYDAALVPYYNPDQTAEYTPGAACKELLHTAFVNLDTHLIGFGTFGSVDNTADGVVFTCYFDIPANAASGTVYQLTMEKVDLTNLDGTNLDVDVVAGSITVA